MDATTKKRLISFVNQLIEDAIYNLSMLMWDEKNRIINNPPHKIRQLFKQYIKLSKAKERVLDTLFKKGFDIIRNLNTDEFSLALLPNHPVWVQYSTEIEQKSQRLEELKKELLEKINRLKTKADVGPFLEEVDKQFKLILSIKPRQQNKNKTNKKAKNKTVNNNK